MSNPTGDDAPPALGPNQSEAPAPIAPPWHVEPQAPGERARSAAAAVVVAAVVGAAGLGIGLLWLQLAPRLAIIKVADGFVYADQDPEEAIAADGVFGFLGLGAGLAVALLAWVLLRRYRGLAVLIGLVVGSLAAGWLAWWLGVRLGVAQFDSVRDSAPVGARLEAPLTLRMTDLDRHAYWPPQVTGVVAVQALVAAATYTTLAGFSIYPGLRPRRQSHGPETEFSSAPAVPADPTG